MSTMTCCSASQSIRHCERNLQAFLTLFVFLFWRLWLFLSLWSECFHRPIRLILKNTAIDCGSCSVIHIFRFFLDANRLLLNTVCHKCLHLCLNLSYFSKASKVRLIIIRCTTALIAAICSWPATTPWSITSSNIDYMTSNTTVQTGQCCNLTAHISRASILIFPAFLATWECFLSTNCKTY